jgi:hypothetical protein
VGWLRVMVGASLIPDAVGPPLPLWRRMCAALLMAIGVTWLVAEIMAVFIPSFDCYPGQRAAATADWSINAAKDSCSRQPTSTSIIFPTPVPAAVPSSVASHGSAPATRFTSLLEIATVAVDVANVRSDPSIASSVIEQLPHGTPLQLVGQMQYADRSIWFEAALPDQRVGWVAMGWVAVGISGIHPTTAMPIPEQAPGGVCGMCPMMDSYGNYAWWYHTNGGHSSSGTPSGSAG